MNLAFLGSITSISLSSTTVISASGSVSLPTLTGVSGFFSGTLGGGFFKVLSIFLAIFLFSGSFRKLAMISPILSMAIWCCGCVRWTSCSSKLLEVTMHTLHEKLLLAAALGSASISITSGAGTGFGATGAGTGLGLAAFLGSGAGFSLGLDGLSVH